MLTGFTLTMLMLTLSLFLILLGLRAIVGIVQLLCGLKARRMFERGLRRAGI